MSVNKKAKGRGIRAETGIFLFLMIFFFVVTAIYWIMSEEVIGTIALGLAGGLSAIMWLVLLLNGISVGKRPEDDHDAEIAGGAGELGFFPPKSIWPFWVALCITMVFLGIVFGWWISLLGFGLGIWAVSGWVFEFYRGDYAH